MRGRAVSDDAGLRRQATAQKEATAEEVRFETQPAKQGQCDWANCGRMLERNVSFALYLFVMVLGYSRKTFAKFTSSMDELTLQRCHAEAFAFFGGVPYSVLYDNPKTVTIGRTELSEPIWQKDFEDFAARYGSPTACPTATPIGRVRFATAYVTDFSRLGPDDFSAMSVLAADYRFYNAAATRSGAMSGATRGSVK